LDLFIAWSDYLGNSSSNFTFWSTSTFFLHSDFTFNYGFFIKFKANCNINVLFEMSLTLVSVAWFSYNLLSSTACSFMVYDKFACDNTFFIESPKASLSLLGSLVLLSTTCLRVAWFSYNLISSTAWSFVDNNIFACD